MGRAVTGILTGGLSEVARAGVKALTPKIPGIPPTPKIADVAQNKKKREDERARKGRRSTILTQASTVKKPLSDGTETLG